jgi:hypothetical protein
MIGYTFNSVGFGIGDLLLFVFSLVVGAWLVKTLRHRRRSRIYKLIRGVLALLAMVPFLMLGSTFLAVKMNAPTAITSRSTPGLQEMAINMGSVINSQRRESEPSFTADGRTMYFNCQDADICVSYLTGTWERGAWTEPERLGAPISTGYFEVEPLINAAGDKLYFQSNRPAGNLQDNPLLSPFVASSFLIVNYVAETRLGVVLFDGFGLADIWVSYKVNGMWSEPINLKDAPGEPPVNTAFHDHCLSFSTDGNEAFWTSTRPGGYGNNDIWTSRRVNGKWTEPENLGSNVNGSGDEHHSIPSPDGTRLYVTTTREDGFGGEDNYVTHRDTENRWGKLENLGPLINGAGNDRCLAWTPDNKILLFDSTRGAGFGSVDLWWIHYKDITYYPDIAVHNISSRHRNGLAFESHI